MKTKFTIKNFRVFDENGVTLDLEPITILTGANGSGKSSIVKSIGLLIDVINCLKAYYNNRRGVNPPSFFIDFAKKEHSILGDFSTILNQKSHSNKIIFSYTTYSCYLSDNVEVEYGFTMSPQDNLKNGYISSISVKRLDGKLIYSYMTDGKTDVNLNLIIQNFYRFEIAKNILCKRDRELIDKYETDFIKEYGQRVWDDIIDAQNKSETYYKNYFDDFKSKSNRAFVHWEDMDKLSTTYPDFLVESCNNDILFYLNILNTLKNTPKMEVRNTIFQYIDTKGNIPHGYMKAFNKVMSHFEGSSFSSFVDYYSNLEKKYLCSKKDAISPLEIHICPYYLDYNNEGADINSLVDFSFVFDTIKNIMLFTIFKDDEHICDDRYFTHRCGMMFQNWTFHFLSEVCLYPIPSELESEDSSSFEIKKEYFLESNDKISNLLKTYFEAQNKSKSISNFIDRWIKRFELGNRLSINRVSDGFGFIIKLHKHTKDKEGTLLAFDGYGASQLVVILLRLYITIIEHSLHNRIQNFFRKIEPTTLTFSEPEIHLHPKLQSLLADLFVEVYKEFGIHVIVETHSDFLIRKLQILVAQKKIEGNDISILYLDNPNKRKRKKLDPQVRNIRIKEDGTLTQGFASGFYDLADDLSMDLLKAVYYARK